MNQLVFNVFILCGPHLFVSEQAFYTFISSIATGTAFLLEQLQCAPRNVYTCFLWIGMQWTTVPLIDFGGDVVKVLGTARTLGCAGRCSRSCHVLGAARTFSILHVSMLLESCQKFPHCSGHF